MAENGVVGGFIHLGIGGVRFVVAGGYVLVCTVAGSSITFPRDSDCL
jgi:hypothetical protein